MTGAEFILLLAGALVVADWWWRTWGEFMFSSQRRELERRRAARHAFPVVMKDHEGDQRGEEE